ncbi:MAG: helix-turn-helix domain-containing protein [Spirochaetes bacterium]|nr:helix-turn-helix domain-containing protein [Spirochaetota bacterium]
MKTLRLIALAAALWLPSHLYADMRLPRRLEHNIDIGRDVRDQWRFSPHPAPENRKGDGGGWSTVATFPHNWKDPGQVPNSRCRIAWYRLRIRVPADFSYNGSLLVRIGPVNDADETFFNGKLIGKTGEITEGEIWDHGYDAIRLYYIPDAYIRRGAINTLSIRIQSFFPGEGGFVDPAGTVVIGPDTDVRNTYLSGELAKLLFAMIIFILALFFAYRSLAAREVKNLFLMLANLSASLYFFVQSQTKFLLGTDYHHFKRLEYGLVLYIGIFLMDYFALHYPDGGAVSSAGAGMRKAALYAVNALPLPFILFLCISSNIVMWDRCFNLLSIPLWFIPAAVSFVILVRELRRGSPGALAFLIAMSACTGAMINDILSDRGLLEWGQVSHLTLPLISGAAVHLQLISKRRLPLRAGKITDATAEKIEAVKAYLDENYCEDVSRENLAASLDISPDHLSRHFKGYTGIRMSEYINRLRIRKAAGLLADTDTKIIDIAHDCGFESLRSFNRVFRNIMKCPPLDYRKKGRGVSGLP